MKVASESGELKKIGLTVGLIFGLNLVYKGLFLSANPIGLDEPFSVFHAQLPVDQIWEILRQGNNPPLYEIFLHYWIKIFGIVEFAVRFPSLLFNAVTAVFVFSIARRSFNFNTGLVAALIFTFSNYQIFFAHEARVYALFGMLATISMDLFMRMYASNKPKRLHVILFILVNTLLIYSHYFGFFIVVLQTFLVFSIQTLRVKMLRVYLIMVLISTICYLPNWLVLINRFLDSAGNGTWVKSPNEISSIYEMFRQFTNAPVVAVIVILLFLSWGIKWLLKSENKSVSAETKILLIWFFGIFFLMFFVSYQIPMFIDRYLIFISAPIVILIAHAADVVFDNKRIRWVSLSVVVALFAVTSRPDLSNKRPMREVVAKVKALKTEETSVIFCPGDFNFNFAYYYQRNLFTDISFDDPYKKLNDGLRSQKIWGVSNVTDMAQLQTKAVIYVDAGADFLFPDNGILPFLQENGRLIENHKFGEVFGVYLFQMEGG